VLPVAARYAARTCGASLRAAGIPDGTGDFGIMSFQSKVASVVQMHLGVRVVTLEGLSTGNQKKGSLLPHTASEV
jgi:hypothetical protein